jgi:integrase
VRRSIMARRKQPDPIDPNTPEAFGGAIPPVQAQSRKRKAKRRGRGEGTIYQRSSDKRWATEITLPDGKRKTIYGKTQEAVIVKKKQVEAESRQGHFASGPRQKLGEHLTWWLEEVHRQTIRPTSYARYRVALDTHILPELGNIPIQKVTTQRLQSFYNAKLKAGQSPSSVHTMHKILHKALAYAMRVHLIAFNPADYIALPRQTKRKVVPLTLEQARHLLTVAQGTHLEMLVTLALTTGMRHGELAALRWEDIDLEKGTIFVHRTVMYQGKGTFLEGDPKTEAGVRTIPISQLVCDRLRVHKVRQYEQRWKAGPRWEDRQLVCCTRWGGFLTGADVRRAFYRLLEKAGLPKMHIHDLRHTASTLFQSLGVSPKTVQEILGHSEVDQTFDYTHVLQVDSKAAAEKMNILFQ